MGNTLAAMKGKKKPSKKENDDLISLMLGEGIDAPTIPEPTKTRLSKEAVDECIAAINATSAEVCRLQDRSCNTHGNADESR